MPARVALRAVEHHNNLDLWPIDLELTLAATCLKWSLRTDGMVNLSIISNLTSSLGNQSIQPMDRTPLVFTNSILNSSSSDTVRLQVLPHRR